jgi:hypothetical protein
MNVRVYIRMLKKVRQISHPHRSVVVRTCPWAQGIEDGRMTGARGSREDDGCTRKSQRNRSGSCEREQHRCEEQLLHVWIMPC